uniref:Fimbrial protein n=1 Tax=Heterorhabditis bacteriophora TaxID=37862 RepID=A0A1I7X0E0_HETBA
MWPIIFGIVNVLYMNRYFYILYYFSQIDIIISRYFVTEMCLKPRSHLTAPE